MAATQDTKVSQSVVFLGFAAASFVFKAGSKAQITREQPNKARRCADKETEKKEKEKRSAEWVWNAKYLVDARSSMRAQSICKMLIDSLVVNQFWLPAKCQSSRSRSHSPKMARQITWPCQSMQQSVTTFVRQSFTQSVSHALSQSVSFAASHKLVAAEEEGEEAEAATPNTASSAIYVVHRERDSERERMRWAQQVQLSA